MDLEELQTFVEIADAGGVSAAAVRLGITKSVVSRRLARIENELGVQLLTRNTRGAALTEAGSSFRDFAAKACAEFDAVKETILPAGDLRGRLRIAAPLSFGPTHIAPVLAQMAALHPRLQIQSCYSDRVADLVADGYDCAIRLGFLQDSNLVAKRIGPIYGMAVASPDYIKVHGAPETLAELAEHQALMQGTETWKFTDNEKVVVVHPQGRFKADNGTALLAAALAGLGVAYLPEGLLRPHLTSGDLVPVLTRYPVPPAGMYVVRPAGQHPSRKVQVLTEMLIACFEPTS